MQKEKMECSECIWWDTSQSFDNKRNWCKCTNPIAPGLRCGEEKTTIFVRDTVKEGRREKINGNKRNNRGRKRM